MHRNRISQGALPARFRRPRVLIIGCGDVGQRTARVLQGASGATRQHGPRVLALTSSPARADALRAQGITPLVGNLDDAATLSRLRGVGQYVVHMLSLIHI